MATPDELLTPLQQAILTLSRERPRSKADEIARELRRPKRSPRFRSITAQGVGAAIGSLSRRGLLRQSTSREGGWLAPGRPARRR